MHEFIMGFLIAGMIDTVWQKYGSDTLRVKIRSQTIDKILFETLEHYHWGLVLLLPEIDLLSGIATLLFISEIVHDHPFAEGKRYFKYSCLIGSILLILNILKMIGVL